MRVIPVPVPPPDGYGLVASLGFGAIALAGIIFLAYAFLDTRHRRRHNEWPYGDHRPTPFWKRRR